MISVQVPKAAGQAGKALRRDVKSPPASHSAPARTSDKDMMYAWSIGVTDLGRGMAQPSQPQDHCPPEVYIG